MTIEHTIQPLNVAGATLLFQMLLLGIIFITSILYRRQYKSYERHSTISSQSLILVAFLITFSALIMSDEFYKLWSPLFNGTELSTMNVESAINFVFIVDIFLIGVLMYTSGGSHDSPYTPALFAIPSIAIFLRVSPNGFVAFAVIAGLIYLWMLSKALRRESANSVAIAFMGIACLALAIFTGYITRPVPIDQLQAASNYTTKQPQ